MTLKSTLQQYKQIIMYEEVRDDQGNLLFCKSIVCNNIIEKEGYLIIESNFNNDSPVKIILKNTLSYKVNELNFDREKIIIDINNKYRIIFFAKKIKT